jgi:TetR/AcrR family transcriptional regulator
MRTLPANLADRLPLAAETFAERGFEQTRIEDVAEAVGIPKATLYYYFAGKEEILAFLLNRTLGRMAAEIETVLARGTSAVERLAGVVKAQLAVMAAEPATCRVLLEDLGRAVRIPEVETAVERAYYAPLRRLLAEGRRDGSLRVGADPEALAAAIFGAVTITGLHVLLRHGGLRVDALARQLTDFVLHGIGAS